MGDESDQSETKTGVTTPGGTEVTEQTPAPAPEPSPDGGDSGDGDGQPEG